MCRECRERFPCQRLQRKPLVSDPGMHHGTCVTHVPWCMSGLLTRDGGENVPGIPGACATLVSCNEPMDCTANRQIKWILWLFIGRNYASGCDFSYFAVIRWTLGDVVAILEVWSPNVLHIGTWTPQNTSDRWGGGCGEGTCMVCGYPAIRLLKFEHNKLFMILTHPSIISR